MSISSPLGQKRTSYEGVPVCVERRFPQVSLEIINDRDFLEKRLKPGVSVVHICDQYLIVYIYTRCS